MMAILILSLILIVCCCCCKFVIALTQSNKDKADIALDDAETNEHFLRSTQYGMHTTLDNYIHVTCVNKIK